MGGIEDMFLWNCWYAAAWDYEVVDGKKLARTFLEKPVVIFKGQSGKYIALDNRCCHRGKVHAREDLPGSSLPAPIARGYASGCRS